MRRYDARRKNCRAAAVIVITKGAVFYNEIFKRSRKHVSFG